MEATVFNSSSTDKSVSSSFKQLGNNAKRNNRILNPSSSNFHGGILHAPPLSLSYSSDPQPPLLPLPIPKPNNHPRNRGISCPPVNRKISNNKQKSSKATTFGTQKKGDAITKQALKKASSGSLVVIPSGKPVVGPDTNNHQLLPEDDVYGLFALSPPPSSLPLPTFTLRPKLGCNAEAAGGIDAGATDNLRRLLRLR